MKHPDLKVTNTVIKDSPSFKIRLESWESVAPTGLLSINFIQECLNKDGNVDSASTYNFHMTRNEVRILCEGLSKV